MTERPKSPWLRENLEALEKTNPGPARLLKELRPLPGGGDFLFSDPDPSFPGIILVPDPENPGLLLADASGNRGARLTSMNPKKEDELLARKFLERDGDLLPARGLTALGLGFGHHLELVLPFVGGKPLFLWDASWTLFAAAFRARDMRALLSYPELVLSAGKIAGLPPGAPSPTLVRPATRRHFSALLPGLSGDGGNGTAAVFSDAPKKKGGGNGADPGTRPPKARIDRAPRVLLFRSGYYLDRELANALAVLGANSREWDIRDFRDKNKNLEKSFAELLEIIRNFVPDLILTVNHIGFDEEGILEDILSRLGLPAASWFVDSPACVLGAAKAKARDAVTVFSWDSDWLGCLGDLGFENVRYLPLATDESFFRPSGAGGSEREIAFVGDAMGRATEKWLALSGAGREILPELDAVAKEFLANDELLPDSLLKEKGYGERKDLDFRSLSALATWRASRLRRTEVLGSLPRELLTLAGDPEWARLFPSAKTTGNVDYYGELSGFYEKTKVNLNVTSAQMKTGLNQRVFDVPASGAFLLTDAKEQLNPLFENGEVATYGEPGEARDLALHYLDNERERRLMSREARKTVRRRHLYRHRVSELVSLTLKG
ncbi:MAG: glycosyltransferase [Deltaproteobacteria bacterium]|jgi:spore maturation protein CgeB|nr:glycosyltransferase [Deltaproteobacteria bacterium]